MTTAFQPSSPAYYTNAGDLIASHSAKSLPFYPPIEHRLPGTRVPDKHTITAAFALCDKALWQDVSEEVEPEETEEKEESDYFPCLPVTADLTRSFQPHQLLPFRSNIVISHDSNDKLWYASQKLKTVIRSGSIFHRALGETANQGILFAEEGALLTELFRAEDDIPVFFTSLPPALLNNGLFHGNTSNLLRNDDYQDWLSEEAENSRVEQMSGRPDAEVKEDGVRKMFATDHLGRAGSIPDHAFGQMPKGDGFAILVVEEKRMYPGALKDILRLLAHYQLIRVYLGCEKMPAELATQNKGVWVGSPEVGHWYSKVFWQVFAECNAFDTGYFVITDRYHTIFGCCDEDVSLKILHVFTHCLPAEDDVGSILDEDEFVEKGKKRKGIKTLRIPAIDPSSDYNLLHSYMGFLEAYIRIILYIGENPLPGPGHPHPEFPREQLSKTKMEKIRIQEEKEEARKAREREKAKKEEEKLKKKEQKSSSSKKPRHV